MSRGTIVVRDIVARDLVARDIDIWWYWVNIGRYWLVFGGTGSVWGSTGWYLVILGQFNLVLFGIKWYWVNKGLLCLYILKKLMVTSTNQPTDQPTDQPGEYRAICLFRKLENRKKVEICNNDRRAKYTKSRWGQVNSLWRKTSLHSSDGCLLHIPIGKYLMLSAQLFSCGTSQVR